MGERSLEMWVHGHPEVRRLRVVPLGRLALRGPFPVAPTPFPPSIPRDVLQGSQGKRSGFTLLFQLRRRLENRKLPPKDTVTGVLKCFPTPVAFPPTDPPTQLPTGRRRLTCGGCVPVMNDALPLVL